MTFCFPRAICASLSPYLTFRIQRNVCKFVRPIAFSSSCDTSSQSKKTTVDNISTPLPPLFLRPPIFSATLDEIENWRSWAKHLANSVGTKFVDSDDGPSAELLCREIKWLLEDVLEDHSALSSSASNKNDISVRIKLGIDDLYALWKQRIEERRPLQYIVGCEHWRDLVLCVSDGVLIPRPETEMIVDMVEEVVGMNEGFGHGIWADLGTGSGAIAIGIAKILEERGRVLATDLSSEAVSMAELNVQRYDLQQKVEVRHGSWFEPLWDVQGELMGLVSNPPYIPSNNISKLQAEVGRHEPRMALDGGENGIDALLHLCEGCTLALKSGGFFAFETNGTHQSKLLLNLLSENWKSTFKDVKIVSDFAGIQRFVTGFRR